MEIRKALIIGNSQYLSFRPLKNPANDARAIAAVLQRLGFDTTTGIDLDRDAMEDTLRQFGKAIEGASTALFYYAGHGVQVDGSNYIVPVDADIKESDQLRRRTYSLKEVLDVMASRTSSEGSGIVFLDACRDNPFASKSVPSFSGNRGLSDIRSGLAGTSAPRGSFVAFATSPDNVAKDGTGNHSPFTKALLDHIEEPDISIADLLMKVRIQVVAETKGEQHPWDQSSLLTGFYFCSSDRPLAPGKATLAQTSKKPSAARFAPRRAVLGAIGTFLFAAFGIYYWLRPAHDPLPILPAVVVVDYIRCETRFGVQAKAIQLLKEVRAGPSALTDALEARLGQTWEAGIGDREFRPAERNLFLRYLQAKISYEFFLDGWVGSAPSGPPTFTRSETFQDLVSRDIPGCGTGPPVSTLGIMSLVSTFIDLKVTNSLVPAGAKSPSPSSGSSGDFVRTLYFKRVPTPTSSPHTGVAVGLSRLNEPIASPSWGEEYAVRIKLSLGAP